MRLLQAYTNKIDMNKYYYGNVFQNDLSHCPWRKNGIWWKDSEGPILMESYIKNMSLSEAINKVDTRHQSLGYPLIAKIELITVDKAKRINQFIENMKM